MNISYYSQYSDGVKTQSKSKRLLSTRSRAMLGAFVLDRNSPTNIDPNKLLMRKESARLFTVNLNDVEAFAEEKGYTIEKAIAYYECVTQIPQASRKHEFYTNKKHGLPLIAKETEVTIPKVKWYANSWTGHSWVANRSKKDGGAPCFWTKDLAVINDPFSKAWELYEARFPRRGWRVSYDSHDTVEMVYARLLSFIALHSDEPEIHVWIQGTLNGLDPVKMVSRLQKMLSSDGGQFRDDSNATDKDSVPIIVLPSGTGKTTYSKKHDILVDIDDIINAPHVQEEMRELREEAYKTKDFSKLNNKNGELVSDYVSEGKLSGKILLCHSREMLGSHLEVEYLGGAKLTYDEMAKVRDERLKKDELWANFTEMNWKSSNLSIGTREEIDVLITDIIDDYDKLYAMKLDFQPERTKEYISLWNTPLEESHDTWEMYGSGSPQRIPVIPWRVSNLGARTFHKGIPPQLFPPSTFMFERGIGINELKFTEIYSNYSEHVKLRTLTQEDVDTLDYAWLPVGPNMYAMSPIKTGDVSIYGLLTVEDRDFFMGSGSVVTAAHACFGLGRSNKDLIFQKERKDDTNYGTSGHMIASVLAFQSHFLWYMEEVHYNLKTKSSVYAVPFDEPEGGAYHTIHEYRNAIHDMQIIDAKGLYPKYARNNLEICKTFIRYLNY